MGLVLAIAISIEIANVIVNIGGGGGKIYMATAGGKNIITSSDIFEYTKNYIKSILLEKND